MPSGDYPDRHEIAVENKNTGAKRTSSILTMHVESPGNSFAVDNAGSRGSVRSW
jgi:hypothetical protein